jgi:uncharacterized Zn finger protein (UPF0148 family)
VISFNCACGEPLAAAPEHAGLQVQCPKCDARFTVPTADDSPPRPPAKKKARLVEEEGKPKAMRNKQRNSGDDEHDPVQRLMDRAHAELDEQEERHRREGGGVHFTPGIIGGFAVFVVFVLLAALCLLALQLYFAIGCLCVAFLGLARCVLSFLGRGVD